MPALSRISIASAAKLSVVHGVDGAAARTGSSVIHRDGLELRLKGASKAIPPGMGIRLSLQQQKGRRTGSTAHLGCRVKAVPGLTQILRATL